MYLRHLGCILLLSLSYIPHLLYLHFLSVIPEIKGRLTWIYRSIQESWLCKKDIRNFTGTWEKLTVPAFWLAALFVHCPVVFFPIIPAVFAEHSYCKSPWEDRFFDCTCIGRISWPSLRFFFFETFLPEKRVSPPSFLSGACFPTSFFVSWPPFHPPYSGRFFFLKLVPASWAKSK